MKLTRKEVALSLDLPLHTLDRWIRQGRIPILPSGQGFEFEESALKKWAVRHSLPFRPPGAMAAPPEESPLENLLPVMKRGGVFEAVSADDVDGALEAAVGLIPAISARDRKDLYRRLLEREHLTSTGIGRGIAIPHPRTPLADVLETPIITTCFLERPIDFNAVDDRPVFVLFVLLSTSVKVHLHLLSRLSFCVRSADFIDFLKAVPAPQDLFARIAQFESHLDGGPHA